MKKIVKALSELQTLMEAEVEKRNETYDSRTENWQESEKGEEYQELTDNLEEFLGQIEEMIEVLGS
jgi:adenylosuccinate synthase